MKIVINECYGGFSVSMEAAEFMAARGNKVARKELDEYQDALVNPKDELTKMFGANWYGYIFNDDKDRTNSDLVTAVEELGESASGEMAELKVVEIPDGIEYTIEEYDGFEHIAEKHRTWG